MRALRIGYDDAQIALRLSARHPGPPQPTRSATAFSSKAISPRRSARSMAAPRSAPGIRSRPRPRSPRRSSSNCARYRIDRGDRQEELTRIVQAEDEIASIGMVIGAGWNGARAFTATSGPGISLMQEFFGLAYFAEIPAVIFDVQRGGPSTGMPTRTQQSDILACAYASHGDTKHVLLFPEDPARRSSSARSAFDLADRLQTPIFVMLDLDIGMNHASDRALRLGRRAQFDRGKVMTGDDLEAGARFRPLSRRRRRRHPLPHLSRHAPDQGLLSSPAAPRATATRATPRKARPTPTTCSGCCASSRPREDLVPRPSAGQRRQADQIRRHLFRLDRAGHGRGGRPARRATATISTGCACAPSRSTRASPNFIAEHDYRVRGRAEPRRPAALAHRSTNPTSIRCGWFRSCITTARRSPRASSPGRSLQPIAAAVAPPQTLETVS